MKPKLLLTSQGIHPELKDTFARLIKKPTETSVAFVTTAAYYEGKVPPWLESYREQLRQFGIEDIEDLDLKDKTRPQIERALENKDIILVNGGSTFYLLHHAKKSGFDKVVPRRVECPYDTMFPEPEVVDFLEIPETDSKYKVNILEKQESDK